MIRFIIMHWKRQYSNKPVLTVLSFVLAMFLCMAVVHLGMLVFSCNVTEIDDIGHLTPGAYSCRMGSEGRWLNWLCFPILALYSPHTAQAFNAICLYIFSFAVLRQYLGQYRSMLFALLPTLFPAFCSLNYWPVTMVPSFLILLCATALHKKIRDEYFFIIFGILMNGVISHFYFLLPLLYIRQDIRGCFRMVALWIIGFVVGYATANIATLIYTGHAIQLDAWRHPHYISSIQDFIQNVKYSLSSILSQVKYFGKPYAIAALMGIANVVYRMYRGDWRLVPQLIIITLVSCSIFAISLYAGIDVETRSVLCLFFGLMLFLVCSLDKRPVILVCAIFLMSMQQYRMSAVHIQHWNTVRHVWQEGLAGIPSFPHEHFRVLMLSSKDEMDSLVKEIRKTYNVVPTQTYSCSSLEQWQASAMALGFLNVNIKGKKELEERNIESGNLIFCDSGCYSYAIHDNLLILRVRHIPEVTYSGT